MEMKADIESSRTDTLQFHKIYIKRHENVRFVIAVILHVLINKLNSSTIDELGEGAWKDGGASSTRAERVG